MPQDKSTHDEPTTEGADEAATEPLGFVAKVQRAHRRGGLREIPATGLRAARNKIRAGRRRRADGEAADDLPAPSRDRHRPYDVFVFSAIDWDFRFTRPQHLALQFVRRGHRVFYVSNRFREGLDDLTPVLNTPADGVTRVVLPGGPDPPDFYSDIPDDLQLGLMQHGLDQLYTHFDIGATLSIVDFPFWYPLVIRLRSNVVVYDCMDRWEAYELTGPVVPALEPVLMAEADLVVCSAQDLVDRAAPHARRIVMIHNGADYQHFAAPSGGLIPRHNAPVVGYVGAISEAFDVAIVAHAARALPDVHFTLVGTVVGVDVAALKLLPNVELVGELPYADVPNRIHGFDVCLIPYVVSDVNIASDPAKVYEYLSAGKPVVAVRVPELERMENLVTLADDAESFVSGIRAALDEDDPKSVEERRAFARDNAWSQRAEALDLEVERFFPRASVVVVVDDRLQLTRACLYGLDQFTRYPNWELVIVDDGSDTATAEFVESWAAEQPHATVLRRDQSKGFASGCNLGALQATGEYLVFLGNDTYVTDGWLADLLAHFRRDDGLGMLGPVTNSGDNEQVIPIAYPDLEAMAMVARKRTRRHRAQRIPLGSLHLFCVVIPRPVWEQVGPLDEEYSIGFFEDDDYSIRVNRAGYDLACAEDVYVHHHPDTQPEGHTQQRFEENRRYFESKWGPWTPHHHRAEMAGLEVERFFPRASVVVVVDDRLQLTRACLYGLDQFTRYPNWELVIVDDGSDTATAEFVESWAAEQPHATVLRRDQSKGFASGCNLGALQATGEYLVFLGNDTYVTDGWLADLLAHFRRDDGLGMLGPVTNSGDNEQVIPIAYPDLEAMAMVARKRTRRHRAQRIPLGSLHLFCVVIPRPVWEQVGPLDEEYSIGFFEDDDYSIRVNRAGYDLACAEDVYVHHHPDTQPEGHTQQRFEENRRYFESKWGPWTPHHHRAEKTER